MRTPLRGIGENEEAGEWEWEYYYDGEEQCEYDEELRRLSPTANTAPTTRATSPFPGAGVEGMPVGSGFGSSRRVIGAQPQELQVS